MSSAPPPRPACSGRCVRARVGFFPSTQLAAWLLVTIPPPSIAPFSLCVQLDPFGHSATQGSLFSSPNAGFTSVVWARISYDDRANRAANKTLEWVWAPSKSLGQSAMTLAHTLRYHYSAPNDQW